MESLVTDAARRGPLRRLVGQCGRLASPHRADGLHPLRGLARGPGGPITPAAGARRRSARAPRKPPSLEQMRERSKQPKFVRSGKTGSWRSEFPPELLEEFWARHGEEMDALGYPRD